MFLLSSQEDFGLPWWLSSKESTCNAGDMGLIPGLGRSPEEGNGYPLRYSCLDNLHGQRSLTGYAPWNRKQFDMTEQLSHTFHFGFREAKCQIWLI